MAKRKNVDDFLIDFSKEESGGGGRIRIPEGTYRVRVIKTAIVKASKSDNSGLQLKLKLLSGPKRARGKVLTETLWATTKAFSRFRTLLEAIDAEVPGQIQLSDIAEEVIDEELYVMVEDEAQEGYRTRSRVAFEGFLSEEEAEDEEEPDDDIEEDDEEEDEPEPPKKRKAKKSKKKSKDEDDDDLDLDEF